MFFDFSEYSYAIRPGITDMRAGGDSLANMVQDEMKLDPLSKTMFLFCNKRKTTIKILAWDGSGFWLMQKRLRGSTFCWPNTIEACMAVTVEDVRRLLMGQNVFRKLCSQDGKTWI